MRKTVQLQTRYKNLNPGEFAGFEGRELEHILTEEFEVKGEDGRGSPVIHRTKIALPAVNLQVAKSFTVEERHKLLNGEAKHLNRDYEPGDRLTVIEAHAKAMLKEGWVETLEEVKIRKKDLKDERGELVGVRDQVIAVTSATASKLEKEGSVRRLSASGT